MQSLRKHKKLFDFLLAFTANKKLNLGGFCMIYVTNHIENILY